MDSPTTAVPSPAVAAYHAAQQKLLLLVLDSRYATADYEMAQIQARTAWDALDDGERDDIRAATLQAAELTGEVRDLTPADEPKGGA